MLHLGLAGFFMSAIVMINLVITMALHKEEAERKAAKAITSGAALKNV